MNPNPNVLAAGLKSSEFITSLIPIVLGVIMMILGMIQKNVDLSNQGMTLLLGGSGIYGVSRGLTKMGYGIGPNIPTDPAAVHVPSTDVEAAKAISKIS